MTRLGQQILRSQIDLVAYQALFRHLKRHQILLACMPKSGSTFLSNAIGRVRGFRKTSLVRHFGRTEQEIDSNLTLRKQRHNFVAQHHVKYNENTATIIKDFGISPVVLTRNIFDCVPSIRDHLRQESIAGPMAFFQEDHLDLNDSELEDMIVQLAIPWYVNFFVSWTQCPGALWVTYEELTTSPAETVERILSHSGRSTPAEQISQALATVDLSASRLNSGRTGRGQMLSEENKSLIRSYCRFYPDIDFSRIGVD